MKKTLFAAICIASCLFSAAAQETDAVAQLDEFAAAEESGDFDEFEDIFAAAEDVDDGIVTKDEHGLATTVHIGDFVAIPLRLSGSLSSSLGAGLIREDAENKWTGYFDFTNYLYLYARPDKYCTVRAQIATSFPPVTDLLRLKELYFDYLLLDRVYITAGKKGTTWGYTRLFSTDFDESKEKEDLVGIDTNILSDSINCVTVMVRIPVWTGTITGVALYRGSATDIEMSDMSYAASMEMTLGKTSVNLFGRKNPNEERNNPHVLGIEAKRTIFGTDIYAQDISQFHSVRGLKHAFTDKTTFTKHLFTAGLYRWWDAFDPNIGFNVEFQGEYVTESGNFYRRIYFDGGVKRLGPKKNIKVGVSWNHQFDDHTGYVKPGVIISGIFPHADWDTGLKIEYGDSPSYQAPKYTFGTYLKLSFGY